MRIAITHTAIVSGSAAEEPLANPRARKMMSRAAYLAARGLADLLRDAGWTDDRAHIGYFLGVGASGGSLTDITALLDRGLNACNPLLAFQLMNNFTMCHGAILEGLGGPNSALFSRGAGTIAAIAEAIHAVRAGDCERAIAGGADDATHEVTVAELTRDGFIARGLVPAGGAALLALTAASPDAVVVEACAHASGRGRAIGDAIDDAMSRAAAPSAVADVVISPWGPPAADALRSFVAARYPSAAVLDVAGGSLAASSALAVVAGVQRLARGPGHVLVLSLGVDGDPGVVVLSRGGA